MALTTLTRLPVNSVFTQKVNVMNISGDDSYSLTQIYKRRLTELCQKLGQKAYLGLEEPIINSRILSEGFYLSQHLNSGTKKVGGKLSICEK